MPRISSSSAAAIAAGTPGEYPILHDNSPAAGVINQSDVVKIVQVGTRFFAVPRNHPRPEKYETLYGPEAVVYWELQP